MKIRILGNVKHDGNWLKKYEVYNIDEDAAKQLITDKVAEAVGEDYPHTNEITPKKRGKNPGELVDAIEGKTEGVKGVEPVQNTEVKGNDEPPTGQDSTAQVNQEEKKGDLNSGGDSSSGANS
jgi:hypothetical protein